MVAWAKKTFQMGLVVILATAMHAAGASGQGQPSRQATHRPAKPAAVRLFGTIEYRSDLKALPQWRRVLSVAGQQVNEFVSCKTGACPPTAKSWRQVMRKAKNKSPMETLKTVNAFFNQWPYRLDIEAYGTSDHWASPNEFLKRSGDCEDYSIVKYFALKQIGFETAKMRIVVVKDRIRNVAHAVLAVYLNETAYILDNLSDLVLPHDRYRHYIPQYSVNGANRWAHIRPIGKQGF
ncbi:MAG: transglutaminase-like cysteine peptidase [Desulfobacteraceae bacterium]|jgi:predicted transglutaminase-like cysteine proteinase